MSIIGIDLGTTTSEVACYKNGEGIVIKNFQEGDSAIIPSVVLIEGNSIKVGAKAKNQMVLKSNNTVIEVKRLMGRDEEIIIDGKCYSPIIISSMILKRIKEIAEFYLGEEVTEAVITVPANFNDKQRKATKEAGLLAGIKVERIINEPTAAAIAYGINRMNEDMNILVYDFGGGTLDVTVMELYQGILDVKASRGNNYLGGKDIDKLIIDYIKESFYKETGVQLDTKTPRILSILRNVSEECKKSLSFENEADIIVPYICVDKEGKPLDLNMTLSIDKLEELSKDIIKASEGIVDDALNSANVKIADIDKVILVGGSTRMPAVSKMLKNKFGISKIVTGINPEEIVAIGAVLQGAIKTGIINSENNIIVADACSHTLGVEVLGGVFDPIIKRDTKLPARVTKRYTTVEDDQLFAEINIYQGEDSKVIENFFIDTLNVRNIPRGKKGTEHMDITFKYDLNGILSVEVRIISTGKIESINVNNIEKTKTINNVIDDNSKKEIDDSLKKQIVDKEELTQPLVNDNISSIGYLADNKNEIADSQVAKVVKSDCELPIESDKLDQEEEELEQEVDELEDEEDYSNIFGEVAALVNYVNKNMDQYGVNLQAEVRSLLQDLLICAQKDEFKNCRDIEHKVLELIGVE